MAGGWEGYGCGGGRLEKNWDNVKQESRGGNGTIRHSELLTGRVVARLSLLATTSICARKDSEGGGTSIVQARRGEIRKF